MRLTEECERLRSCNIEIDELDHGALVVPKNVPESMCELSAVEIANKLEKMLTIMLRK